MAYGSRRTGPSVLDTFSLSPLPYPVLGILAVASVFLFTSWYFSFEEAVEAAGEQMSFLLLAIPLVLIVLVRWLSSAENSEIVSSWGQRRRTQGGPAGEGGSSPWGVAALIVVLLVLLQYQSSFLDKWFV